MKKITSLLLILTMFASLLPTMVFAADNSAFTDVKGTEYYADAANALSSLNILLGYEDGTFGAEKSITRAEMAAIVCRMIDKENEAEKAEGKTNFDDVHSNHWASGYINIASKEGIINGDGNGKFRPEDDVKYEEAIKMVVCALGFGDGVKVDEKDWSAEYLKIANEKGITDNLKGVKNTAATRGDVAVMVYNGLKTDLAVPTASLASGSYTGTKSITLTTATKGADIYYTTDGTTPTVKSTKYTKAISISKTTTLKAITVKNGVLVSDVMSVDYTIKASSGGHSTSKYTVTFDLNYDGKKDTQSVTKGHLVIKPEIDNREGYIFGGWYKDSELTEPFDFDNDTVSENITLYALWNENSTIIKSDIDESKIAESENGYSYFKDQLLLEVSSEKTYADIELLSKSFSGKIIGYIADTNSYQIEFGNVESESALDSIAEELKKIDYIQDVTINYTNDISVEAYYPNDEEWADIPPLVKQWNEDTPDGTNWGVEAIKAPSAWDNKDDFSSLDIGLIEIGIPENHIDLNISNRFKYSDETTDSTHATHVYSTHATHVCGTMAATFDNETGIAGVAPNEKTNGKNKYNVYSYAVSGKGGMQGAKTAFSELLNHNVKVINVSMGYNDAIIFAINHGVYEAEQMIKNNASTMEVFLKKKLDENQDFVIVQAAGNTNNDNFVADNDTEHDTNHDIWYGYRKARNGDSNILHEDIQAVNGYYLSAITNEEVKSRIIVVGGCKNNGNSNYELSDFSNIGDRVDVIAPGNDIYSTIGTNDYAPDRGTSMAAPHVSGLAAMVWSANTNLSGGDVKNIIVSTANQNVNNTDKKMINAERAVRIAKISKSSDEVPVLCFVKDANNHSLLDDVMVDVYDSENVWRQHVSTSNGLYMNPIKPGAYSIKFTKSGYTEKEISVNIESGKINNLPDVYLDTEQRISGKIVTDSNAGLSEVKAEFLSDGNIVKTVYTDSNGNFSTQLPVGVYEINLSKAGYQDYNLTNITLTKGITRVLEPLTMHKLTSGIQGKVYDSSSGLSLENVYISVYNSSDNKMAEGYTNGEGYFKIPCKSGTYSLICEKEMYHNTTVSNVVVEDGLYDVGNVRMNENVEFAGGDGTEEKPYKVSTAQQLNAVRNDLNASYILINDIDLSGYSSWSPIGENYQNAFCGNFNGNNYKITNLNIKENIRDAYYVDELYFGLFGCVHGNVENINLYNANIAINGNGTIFRLYIGAISGQTTKTIKNAMCDGTITVDANFEGSYHCVGGIVGQGSVNFSSAKMMINCTNITDKTFNKADYKVGGIVGYGSAIESNNKASITVCSLSPEADVAVGGIVGDGSAEKCINYNNVSAKADGSYCTAGGIVGDSDNISYCENYSNVTAETLRYGSYGTYLNCSAGGIAGNGQDIAIMNCYNEGNISAIANSLSSGTPTAAAGGIVGDVFIHWRSCNVSNCINNSNSINSIIQKRNAADGTIETILSSYIGCIGGRYPTLANNYSISTTMLNGVIPTDNIGSEEKNGIILSSSEIQVKKQELLTY